MSLLSYLPVMHSSVYFLHFPLSVFTLCKNLKLEK